jgi:hypothetical protein
MSNIPTTTTEAERRRDNNASPQDGVEVFDAKPTSTLQSKDAINNPELPDTALHNSSLGTTDFSDSDLRATDRIAAPETATGTIDRGTNWGAILMIIAVIVVIIWLGSSLF